MSTVSLVASGLVAGAAVGGVLQRADLCFHSMFRRAWARDLDLLATWAYGVAIAAVGLTVVLSLGLGDDLSRGLPFDPVANVAGGLLIGVGMVVASSCVSGLFYKLGGGMAGAVVGLLGWGAGELAVRHVDLPGPRVLDPGDGATLPGLLGVPRSVLSVALLLGVGWWVHRRTDGGAAAWRPAVAGPALGAATIVAWGLAGWGGARFGPSTVGVASGLVDWIRWGHTPPWWLFAFVGGITAGSLVVSAARGTLRWRGEPAARYGGLLIGGALLGAGGRVAGGCNLGHGLSGVALLSVSSWVVVASMALGVAAAAAVQRRLGGRSHASVGRRSGAPAG